MIQNNELYHFGVPGMKWGVRHDKAKSSVASGIKTVKSTAKKEANNFVTNQKVKAQRKAAYRNRANMSEAEMRSMTNRINAENNLKSAINNSDSQLSRQIKTGLVNAVATAAVAGALSYATNPSVRNAVNTGAKTIAKSIKDKGGN